MTKKSMITISVLTLILSACSNAKDSKKQLSDISLSIAYETPVQIDVPTAVLESDSNDVKNKLLQAIREFPQLANYQVDHKLQPSYLEGDFYGDGISDQAILIVKEDSTKLVIIDFKRNGKSLHILGEGPNDDSQIENDFGWIGVFKKIEPNEVLWSNYEDDFRNLKDVPEEEKVYLNYNAIYVHAPESCGGGFIFWKDGKFNWLQQE